MWECRPATKTEEIMRVVRICGIDEDVFLEHFEGGTAVGARQADLHYKEKLGIWSLPAFLVERGERSALIRGVADYDTLMRAVALVADRQCPR